MAQTQIKEMRAPHDAVLDLLLANPMTTLKALSLATGYSSSWLSQMIRSDCFQQEYQRRRGDIEVNVMQDIQTRLESLTHLAIDGMEEMLSKGNLDADTRIDAFDRVLHRTGYAPKSAATAPQGPTFNQQNNVYLVRPEELRGLRDQIISQPEPAALPPPADEPK